jgi:hypothetical protein
MPTFIADHRLNWASMEPSGLSIGGKEVGPTGVQPAQHRDTTMTLIAFRHGRQAAELCDLRSDRVGFGAAVLHSLPRQEQHLHLG